MSMAEPEVHTVTDTEAVVFTGDAFRVYDGLEPASDHDLDGVAVRTLERPPGALLSTVATVNDVHFGERECGRVEGHDIGPVLGVAAGEEPYPEVMNRAAAAEIAAAKPDLVVAKGDLTSAGRPEEYAAFEACYGAALGDRLVVTRGNHDQRDGGPAFDVPMFAEHRVPGAVLAVLDTSRPGTSGGRLDPGQLDALDELAARATEPVLVFAHHPVRTPDDEDFMGEFSVLEEASSEALVALVARRPAVTGYFAGHTHRNRVRRLPTTGGVPFAEVACTKDFPGSWAEYRIYEGGILAVHHRIAAPEALAWSERCRALVFGLYPRYALGGVEDRCYRVARS